MVSKVEKPDGRHPGHNQHHVEGALFESHAAVEARHEVSHGHIDKTGRRQRHEPGNRRLQMRQPEEGEQRPGEHGRAGDDVQNEGAQCGVAVVQQDSEVYHLLRHFVGDDRERRGNAQRNGREKRGSDENAINEVVHRVAHQDENTRSRMHFTRSVVAMPPDQEPFEEEKEHNSPKKSGEKLGGRDAIQGVRDQSQEGCSKQRPDGVAEQVRDKALADSPPAEQK